LRYDILMSLEDDLKSKARSLGFSLVGIARAGPADDFHYLQDWLARGFAGSMRYMEKHSEARRTPESILENVRSVVMVGMEYADPHPHPLSRKAGRGEKKGLTSAPESCSEDALDDRECGRVQQEVLPSPGFAGDGMGVRVLPHSTARIARYACGPDYHDVLRSKLNQLLEWVYSERLGCRGRGVVDTAPLLERDFARRAGLGWIGKNTMLINKHRGSYFFLGALLLDLELSPDAPHSGFHCGTCTACLDACPTDAFAAPGLLDARKCISYLTIELRDSMPEHLRPGVGNWLFGCDVCQEVCPWNRKDSSQPEAVDPIEILGLSESDFRRKYGGTALERTRRRGLVRNAAIVLGNIGDESALPALRNVVNDDDAIVRDAAQWAIRQIEERQRYSKR
jgi:epoxyqueuosine reductase